MVQLSEDLKDLISKCAIISTEYQKMNEENEKLKERLAQKEKLLAALESSNSCLKIEADKKQQLLESIHTQLDVIPGLESKLLEATDLTISLESKLKAKQGEIRDIKKKHWDDMEQNREIILKEQDSRHLSENRRVSEMEDFFQKAHETEIASYKKKVDREKLVMEEKIRNLEEQLSLVNMQHKDEIAKLKIQIAISKNNDEKSNMANAEVCRKRIESLRDHYEKQIEELTMRNKTLALESEVPSRKVSLSPNNVTADAQSKKTNVKRKKVSFHEHVQVNHFEDLNYSSAFEKTPSSSTPLKNARKDTPGFSNFLDIAANKFAANKSGANAYPGKVSSAAGSFLSGDLPTVVSASGTDAGPNNTQRRFSFASVTTTAPSKQPIEFGRFSTVPISESEIPSRNPGTPLSAPKKGNLKRKLFTERTGEVENF